MLEISVNSGPVEKKLARINGVTIINNAWHTMEKPLRTAFETYPPQRKAKQPFKTAKQRKYFFWALKKGFIQVPYRRTDKLKKGWRTKFEVRGASVDLVMWNIEKHADGVMGKNQWGYHKGHWYTAEGILRKFGPSAQRYVQEEARRWT